MRTPTPHRPAGSARSGFTLIEVLIVMVIVGVLAAVALPAYNDSVRKGRRSDAVGALTALQQAQERWRANNVGYADNLTNLCSGGTCATSPGRFYTVSIDTAGPAGYVMTAQPASGSSQAQDSDCSRMRLQLAGGNVFYGGCSACAAPAASAVVSDPKRCWAK